MRATVIGGDGRVLEKVDQSRAYHLQMAPNATAVWSRRGEIARIELSAVPDDASLQSLHRDSRRFVTNRETETNPRGVWAFIGGPQFQC